MFGSCTAQIKPWASICGVVMLTNGKEEPSCVQASLEKVFWSAELPVCSTAFSKQAEIQFKCRYLLQSNVWVENSGFCWLLVILVECWIKFNLTTLKSLYSVTECELTWHQNKYYMWNTKLKVTNKTKTNWSCFNKRLKYAYRKKEKRPLNQNCVLAHEFIWRPAQLSSVKLSYL